MNKSRKAINIFFGLHAGTHEGASPKEVETFIFLLESRGLYAVDFINCWLNIKGINLHLTDENLSCIEKLDIIIEARDKQNKKKKRKK